MEEKPSSKLKGLVWLAAAILLGAAFAEGLSTFARIIPWSTEKKMGVLLGGFSNLKACSNAAGEDALRTLLKRIYPIYPEDSEFPLKVTIVRGPTINAFATLGGQIYVFEGLLKQAESSEELAGVLAHEIEHVRRRHIIEGVIVQLSVTGTFSLIFGNGPGNGGAMDPAIASAIFNMQFGRTQERDADEGGLRRLRDAQIDTAGFKHFFERLQQLPSTPTLLSDHPSNEDRIKLVQRYQATHPTPVLSADEWKLLRVSCN